MLPLDTVSNSGYLNTDIFPMLEKLRDANVNGIMVDVWWGITEPTPKTYNFAPYLQLAQKCQSLGLRLQCVMSFHRCGGNVGDTVTIPLPSWVLQVPGIYYKDKHGNEDDEYISLAFDNTPLFSGRTPLQCYRDFMTAFKSAMGSYFGTTIEEIQVGCGPCGELRYPSYVTSVWKFPGVGEFQCYDEGMKADWEKEVTQIGHQDWIELPQNTGNYNDTPDSIPFWQVNSGYSSSYSSPYGKFFLNWYSNCLLRHGHDVLLIADQVFRDGQNKGSVSLACKISGIHWWHGIDRHPAEATAGYVNYGWYDGRGFYTRFASLCRQMGVLFDFTCFEMKNSEQTSSNANCQPEELVKQVLMEVKQAQCGICAENALAMYDTDHCNQIIANAGSVKGKDGKGLVTAVTFLRLTSELVNNGNNYNAFKTFVNTLKSV
ncbi:putative Beta-amylase 3, chloroplastic [Blattamonas nauphoetae]|uniref:Beta-amylase n=1 Tax=Blattamonas nauphoetae TaxID=2049346 RepID=A0ABQ9WV80_9EUKA|nr:putative Beta-amylase 3, chloroplastic [Blattamonas nauphoetae]